MGSAGTFFIQEAGDPQFFPHAFSNGLGNRIRLFYGTATNRNERNYIYSSHARMLSLMLGHVDDFSCPAGGNYHGVPQRFRFADNGNHSTVMILVTGIIQQFYIFFSPECFYDMFDFVFISSLTEVGNAFHDLVHTYASVLFLIVSKASRITCSFAR